MAYLEENNMIDFNDMINKGANLVRKYGYDSYKYIIVDEYQDTSLAKCLFIKVLATHSKVMVVGDDWQSIYKFSGANLEVFRNFKNYFPYTKTFKLENTYRNSQELLEYSKKVIIKNHNQIHKVLYSEKHLINPIQCYNYSDNRSYVAALVQILKVIFLSKQAKTILILSRYQFDLEIMKEKKVNQMLRSCPSNIKIDMLTIHKAKGLGYDVVIFLNFHLQNCHFRGKFPTQENIQIRR